ncbi:helix-turn-helix domain-containing protein [Rossellomorea aquimaris]|nr:helix-turn-helix transcriptional regulator [Rossellomorea vietnamensis]
MTIGSIIAGCRTERELTQKQLSLDINCSPDMVSKLENGKRKLQKDMMPHISSEIDHVRLTTALWGEVTGGVTIPYLDGDYIDHSPAALVMRALREMDEAEKHLEQVDATKPVDYMSREEADLIAKANRELLDVAAMAITLVGDNCEWFGLSFADEIKSWKVTLKARRFIQK